MRIPVLKREQVILDYLLTNKVATTSFLSELTGTSIATIRRDLNTMSEQGMIKKSYGGVTLVGTPTVQNRFSSYTNLDPHFDAKEDIAKKASKFVVPGDIIFIGAGMTCNLLAKHLKEKENITIVTTNVTAIMELLNLSGISLLLLGGNIHCGNNHVETLDEYTINTLNKLYFNKVFFTVDGIDLNSGYSIINRTQLSLYNHLIQNSKFTYLLADKYKFDKRTFTHLCNIDALPNIITNTSADEKYLSYYRSKGINCYF